MLLYWKIQYLDRNDKQFKDRCLYLLTEKLAPDLRAAVELVAERKSQDTEREIFKFRHLFSEEQITEPSANAENPNGWTKGMGVGPSEYFEDETGKELSGDEVAQILTNRPNVRMLPRGAMPHDLEFMNTMPTPIPVSNISLTAEDVRLLGYFVRDLEELQESAFMKESPGKLTSCGSPMLSPNGNPKLETTCSGEEIRSFVTIFRRLYMENEPANLEKAASVFVKVMDGHAYGKWVEGATAVYCNCMASVPSNHPFFHQVTLTFNTKRLIDIFINTKFAHQPNDRRSRQFKECLAELHNKEEVLTWLFLSEIWRCALKINSIGNVIAGWYKMYCSHHGVSPEILDSLQNIHEGLGASEKEQDRRQRLHNEKIEQLSIDLWKQAGSPAAGAITFLEAARTQLASIFES